MEKNLFDSNPEGMDTENEETYTLKVEGQEISLTLEQLLQAATIGLEKGNRIARQQNAAESLPDGKLYTQFLEAYPDIKPADIPSEVWETANREGNLLSAYRQHEVNKLRSELEALKKNAENRKSAVGSAVTDGDAAEIDPVIAALFGK